MSCEEHLMYVRPVEYIYGVYVSWVCLAMHIILAWAAVLSSNSC